MEVEINAGIAQGRIVEGFEGIESVGILLGRTISTQQFSTEIDAHLGHKRRTIGVVRGSKIDAGDEVFFAVGSQLAQRQLTSREDNRLRQILQHKRKGRCCVGHRVGSMQNHEAIISVIIVRNDAHEMRPKPWCHVA